MIINNPDALKSWLTIILEPLCDADPSALARYVFALLKKEKSIKELKKSMNEQLDVFLADETKGFVERLFEAIASEEYLTDSINQETNENGTAVVVEQQQQQQHPQQHQLINSIIDKSECELSPPSVQQQQQSKTKEPQTTKTPINMSADDLSNTASSSISVSGSGSGISYLDGNPSMTNIQASTILASPNNNTNTSVSPAKTASDKENNPRENRRRRASLRSRSRSRSRSNERVARRSRSRDRRAAEREKMSRQFRNKSPPPNERRRLERRTVADRSPRHGGGFGGSKNRTRSHSGSRSRSGSPERRKISRSSSPSTNDTGNGGKRQRCRDFDEKGYCVRGETCPWDHGINPVVLEGINNTALLNMPQHLREYNPDSPELWNRSGGNGGGSSGFSGPRGAFPPPHKVGGNAPGAYPRPPGISFRPAGPPFPFAVNPAATPLQRELISVPVVDANAGGDITLIHSKRRYEPEDTVAIAEGPPKRKPPINSRLGPRVNGPHPQQNCSLELRKIPRGMNTIAHLNNHFSKFGKIVNIQISYDGDPEAAIITFSNHAEANVAYRSTEAVLNNRFIKVFWHSGGPNPDSNTQTTNNKDDVITNGRKNSQYHLNNMPAMPLTTLAASAEGAKTSNVPNSIQPAGLTGLSNTTNIGTINANATTTTNSGGQTTNSVTNIAATHIQQSSMRLKNNRPIQPIATNAIIRKKKEEQAKAVVQLAHGLRKRKRELIQEYFKEMKAAVELLERMDQLDPQRPKMLETIKNLQSNIDNLNKELSTEQAQIAAQIQPPLKKTKEEQKKELLDIELELFNQQQEGNDTTAIQKRLENLQRSIGISSQKQHFSNKIGVGGGGPRASHRIRAAPPGSTSFDRRPKTLLITGFAKDDCDVILGHFKHFGEITKQEIDKSIPQIIIAFSTRSTAEQAVIRGRIFKEKQLQISWAPSPAPIVPATQLKELQPKQHGLDNGLIGITNDKILDLNMEADNLELRLEDEEEEDESEDRSWRR